ncbi:unnamed protein product, partial [Medioppia subpectinata]
MIRELAVYEKMPEEPRLDRQVLERDGFDRSGDPLFRTFVAERTADDGSREPIGYALYYSKYNTWEGRTLWMEDLYVKSEYRGSGVGFALMQAVTKQTVDEGCARLEWNCLDWNQKFYKKLGAINSTETDGWQCYRLTAHQCSQLANASHKSQKESHRNCINSISMSTKAMFTIREGRKEDCRQLLDMIVELGHYFKTVTGADNKQTVSPVVSIGQLEENGFCADESRRMFSTFVAESVADPNQLVGYTMYYPKFSTWTGRGVWMESLYVKQEFRGTGAGAALMAAVAKKALTDGCERFEWDSYECNHGSMAFYKKLGSIDTTHDYQIVVFRLNEPEMKQLAARADPT